MTTNRFTLRIQTGKGIYAGYYKDNKRNGKGKYAYASGSTY